MNNDPLALCQFRQRRSDPGHDVSDGDFRDAGNAVAFFAGRLAFRSPLRLRHHGHFRRLSLRQTLQDDERTAMEEDRLAHRHALPWCVGL